MFISPICWIIFKIRVITLVNHRRAKRTDFPLCQLG
jgi:hypothetical protein